MTHEDKGKEGLVHSQSPALAQAAAASLVLRGMADLQRLESAERWYEEGLNLWTKERDEQEYTGARLVCPWNELDLLDQEGYRPGFECFQRGIALNPNHVGLQDCIGDAYYFGQGVVRNPFEAAVWYRRAADQGYRNSQYVLGWMYEHGQGVTQDHDEAAAWYRLAAAQGDERAQEALDDMLRQPDTIPDFPPG